MTDDEKLHRVAAAILRTERTLSKDFREQVAQMLLETTLLGDVSAETLAWCRANREVIEALREGTWVALPREPTLEMIKAADKPEILRGATPYIRQTYQTMLAEAPKRPEG